MKFIVLSISLLRSTCIYSQNDTIENKNFFYSFSVGYKTDTKWIKDVINEYGLHNNLCVGTAWLKAEHKIDAKLALGLEIGIGDFSEEPGMFSFDGISASIYHIRILPSIRYNFFERNKVTIYSSAGIGYYRMGYKINHLYRTYIDYLNEITITEKIADQVKSGIDWTVTIGTLIYIRKGFGIVAEVGANKSIGSIGLFLRSGYKQ